MSVCVPYLIGVRVLVLNHASVRPKDGLAPAGLRLCVYRTPIGVRVLVLNRASVRPKDGLAPAGLCLCVYRTG